MAHISEYLNFKEHPCSKKRTYDNSQIAYVESGSHIKRNQTPKGLEFQLFLNKVEYETIENSKIDGIHKAHFYGSNYIYLPPCSHIIIPICQLLKFKNDIIDEWL